ncbi:hypothetical protein NEOLEDRAFT_1139020 [Neolentinus lepideus HHB14362 ss-1]|uniref:Protein-S-isoprenylcysteine O-methyltransferase n=1 Tax=Neolentinus lepideus HHB14362 ss-1 TaxID=1314782 RepID=A0A165Q1Q6_9AGAM|nr:hypothetical protein NEOLEDRAFT_1139020 [Neolentinus lepideus HHB14362 ss-1]
MSLLRASSTLLAAYCAGYAYTPPQPPVSEEERKAFRSPESKFSGFVRLWAFSLKVIWWAGGLCEAAAIVASNSTYPPLTNHVISTLVGSAQAAAPMRVSPTFLFGVLVTVIGSYLRHCCYKALGKLFTYELAIRNEHQLVTTGPYSMVRHPSYTGSIVAALGIHICTFSPGTLLRQSGILRTWVGAVIITATALHGVLLVSMFTTRAIFEDINMKKQFGEQWDRWAARVRYRLVPVIF